MAKTGVIRIDDTVKRNAEKLFEEMGMSASTAVEVFFRQVMRSGKFPFEIQVTKVPNEITMAAIHEGDEMLKNGTGKSHTFSRGMFNRILEEDNEE